MIPYPTNEETCSKSRLIFTTLNFELGKRFLVDK